MKRAVYIGTEEAQELAAHVLRATIEARSGGNAEVLFLNRAMAAAGFRVDNSVGSNTPFSKQRVFVPKLAGSGQAAYLDSDMVVFRDINELFDHAGGTAIATCPTRQQGRDPQSAVTVFNVARCHWDPEAVISEIDADKTKYQPYLYQFTFAGGIQRVLPPSWNDLESYEPGTTCLLHFTDMETQPWLTSANRNADVWLGCLREAVESGRVTREMVVHAVDAFHVRPSLLWQMDNGWVSTARLPFLQRLRDVLFYVPPYSLSDGIPFGVGAMASRLVNSRAPRIVKTVTLLVSGIALLARRRRRVLVWATLRNRCCLINRWTERVLDDLQRAPC